MAPKSKKEVKVIHEDKPESETSSSAESSSESDVDQANSPSDSDSSSATSSDQDNEKSTNSNATQKSSTASAFRSPGPYKPPTGFKRAKKQSPPSSNTSPLLSDLRGKQVFHITAPSFLPLSKVKEVSLAHALQGEPVLKHDGVKYGIPVDSLKETAIGQTLFVYNPKSETYYNTAANVPTYHIQEIIELPGAENDEIMVEAAKKFEKPPRKQPKHLKMRFRPVGSGDGPAETIGSSSESEGEQPTFKVPRGLEKEKERKRKHQQTEGDGSQPAGVPRKKSKKHSSGEVEDDSVPKEKSKKSSKDRDGKKKKKSEKA